MEKVYAYRDATVYVILPDTSDWDTLKKATEEFLRKVISEVEEYGNCNQSKTIRKE